METGDELAEFAIDFLVSGRGSARALTRELATRWPDHPALEYVLVLSLAANGIESTLTGAEADLSRGNRWARRSRRSWARWMRAARRVLILPGWG